MMIDLTPKLQPFMQLGVSPTLGINQKITKLKQQGVKVAHFGFGQSPFPVPELLVESFKECAGLNHYLPTQGLDELRAAIAEWLVSEFGIQARADQVFVGPGSKECLFHLFSMLEGDLLIPQGSWVSYKPQAILLNKPYHILPTYEQDRYCLNAEVLKQFLGKETQQKILVLNNPNNPTGQVYEASVLKEIANVCREHKVIVISDEIYNRVLFEPNAFVSMQKFYPEGTVITNGLSKSFSAGGYRLGYAVLPENFKAMFGVYNALISETYTSVNTPLQYASVSVFQHFDKVKPYLDCCNHIHRWVLNYVYQQLTNLGYTSTCPQAGFYLFVHLNKYREQLNNVGIYTSTQLCDYLLDKYGVAVLPAKEFYFDDSYLGFRLSPVDYAGLSVLTVFSSQNAEDKLAEWFPNIKFGLDQLAKFLQAVTQQ